MKVWQWFKENYKAILAFFIVLTMGASIVPAISGGKNLVAAIQFEKMAETAPAYIVMREVEAQTRYYVLSIEEAGNITVLWILVPPDWEYDEEIGAELYAIFGSLAENYNTSQYIIVAAFLTALPAATGPVTAFRGLGFFECTAMGVEAFIAGGIEDADASLTILFANNLFRAQTMEWQEVYMSTLLPREPGHVPPWEEQ